MMLPPPSPCPRCGRSDPARELAQASPPAGAGGTAGDNLAVRLMAAQAVAAGAYAERNQLVAALSRLLPASLEPNPDQVERETGWAWIVYVQLPTGQATWHVPDAELALFDHLPRDTGATWDRHTTDQKYRRLARAWVRG